MSDIRPKALALDVALSPVRAVQWVWRWCGYVAKVGPTGGLMDANPDEPTALLRQQRDEDNARRREARERRLRGLDEEKPL